MTDEAKALAFVLRRGEWDRELCKYVPTDERNQAADLIETQARENERLRELVKLSWNEAFNAKRFWYDREEVWKYSETRAALAGDSHDK